VLHRMEKDGNAVWKRGEGQLRIIRLLQLLSSFVTFLRKKGNAKSPSENDYIAFSEGER